MITTSINITVENITSIKELRGIYSNLCTTFPDTEITVFVRARYFISIPEENPIFNYGWEKVTDIGYKYIILGDIDGCASKAINEGTFSAKFVSESVVK